MHDDYDIDNLEGRCIALVRKYDRTIKLVAGLHFRGGDYRYRTLVCDLTTHLWEVYGKRPYDMDEEMERAWVYVVLSHKARDLVRNDQLHYSRIKYCDQLPEVAADEGQSPLVERLYELVRMLDKDDRELLNEYLNSRPIAEIGKTIGKSQAYVFRQLARIRKKLCELNEKID